MKAIAEGDENAIIVPADEITCVPSAGAVEDSAGAVEDSACAVEGSVCVVEDVEEPSDSEAVSGSSSSAIASLERRTTQTLFISKEARDRVKQGDLFKNCETASWSNGLAFHDIDNDHSDPQMCSTYAADIYMHLRMAEVRIVTFSTFITFFLSTMLVLTSALDCRLNEGPRRTSWRQCRKI